MYKLIIHTDKGQFEINIDKLQELDTILINYDGYDYVRATEVKDSEKELVKRRDNSGTMDKKPR